MGNVGLSSIFTTFLRLGATAYGGPAMMAPLRALCVGKRQWLTEQEFKEGMALCQVIPGATMVQMAAYVGYRLRRLPGALMAAVGFILPAFLLMAGLSAAYFQFGDLPLVRALFRGLAAIVVAIVLNASLTLGRTTIHGWQGVLLAALAFGALAFRVSLVLVLLGAALLALVLFPRTKGGAASVEGGGK
jgi:chromate transporter